MIKHIVLFKFKNENKDVFMKKAKQELEGLVEKIEELKEMEVGISYLGDDSMPDLSLTSSFENIEGLKIYANHPYHMQIVAMFKPMVISRWVVDYEI